MKFGHLFLAGKIFYDYLFNYHSTEKFFEPFFSINIVRIPPPPPSLRQLFLEKIGPAFKILTGGPAQVALRHWLKGPIKLHFS